MKNLEFNMPLEQEAAKEKAVEAAVVAAELVGTWVACNKATRSIVRVVIGARGTNVSVHVFGACTPTPCDWGVVDGVAYAKDVSATDALAFTAPYKFGFKTALVTGRLDEGSLIVETYNVFTDASGRSNYYTRGYFCKQ